MALIRPSDGGTCAWEDVYVGLGSSSGAAANARWGDMAGKLILTGDVNLMNVADPAIPFRQRGGRIARGGCRVCKPGMLPAPAGRGGRMTPKAFLPIRRSAGKALRLGGIHAVGIANNVNYGADNIAASLARLDRFGVPHTGAGANLAAARAPAMSPATGCASASCSAARCIGRPITKPAPTHPASP